MKNISVNENTSLELASGGHAVPLFALIDSNRDHLSEFLPWVGNMTRVEDVRNYLKNCEQLYQQKKEVSFVIMHKGALAGRIGLHHLNRENKIGAIGYWLDKKAGGQGIITQSCMRLIRFGFLELGLHRIEIKASVNNFRSQAIAERLHFKKEGILRQAEWVNNKFTDLVLFSLLMDEWKIKS
jgi:ribosomal-protein-serine acetyltransferase